MDSPRGQPPRNIHVVAAPPASAEDGTTRKPRRYAPAYHPDAAAAIGDVEGASFGLACETVAAFAEAGIETTVTSVASPGAADAAGIRELGLALGAMQFKERTFLE